MSTYEIIANRCRSKIRGGRPMVKLTIEDKTPTDFDVTRKLAQELSLEFPSMDITVENSTRTNNVNLISVIAMRY